jgi:hypothetical protein
MTMHNDTQPRGIIWNIQHYDIQHYDAQHNDTQHKEIIWDMQRNDLGKVHNNVCFINFVSK